MPNRPSVTNLPGQGFATLAVLCSALVCGGCAAVDAPHGDAGQSPPTAVGADLRNSDTAGVEDRTPPGTMPTNPGPSGSRSGTNPLATRQTRLRVTVYSYTVPRGASGDAQLGEALDEDFAGVVSKAHLRLNGLRLAQVVPHAVEGLLDRLAQLAVEAPRQSAAVAPARGAVTVPMRSWPDARLAMFSYSLDGRVSGRHLRRPALSLTIDFNVPPTEPDRVNFSVVPLVRHRLEPLASVPTRGGAVPRLEGAMESQLVPDDPAADAPDDLPLRELLALLPTYQAQRDRIAEEAAEGIGGRWWVEPLGDLRTSAVLRGLGDGREPPPNGSVWVLLTASPSSAASEKALTAGWLMLCDGPPDVGVEQILVFEFRRAAEVVRRDSSGARATGLTTAERP